MSPSSRVSSSIIGISGRFFVEKSEKRRTSSHSRVASLLASQEFTFSENIFSFIYIWVHSLRKYFSSLNFLFLRFHPPHFSRESVKNRWTHLKKRQISLYYIGFCTWTSRGDDIGFDTENRMVTRAVSGQSASSSNDNA